MPRLYRPLSDWPLTAAFALGLVLGRAGPALAADEGPSPQPARPVEMSHLVGRWYEIARVPNLAENNCPFATSDWQPQTGGRFQVTTTCSRAENAPATRIIKGTAEPLDPAGHAKWRMSYFGGLIHREYWFVDHAPDDDWVILAMPGKPYVWILSRQAELPTATRDMVVQRVASLGYDVKRLVFPLALTG